MSRTIVNAQYQLDHIMPLAREEGCACPYTEADFPNFIKGKWHHQANCPSPKYECLPNAVRLFEALRVGP
jgi:hypothetical protein